MSEAKRDTGAAGLRLTCFNRFPDELLHIPAWRLWQHLEGPSLFQIAGRRPEPLFISVLLHAYTCSMKVLAAGIGASAELIYGKLQAGIVFQTSWTVGLLLAVTPQSKVWPSRSIDFAKRMSVLSQLKLWATPSQVPWMNAPKFSVKAPPVKRLHLLHDKVVVHTKAGCGTAWLSTLGIRKSRLQHDRKRRALPVAAAQSVATQLEATAERGQLQKRRMAGRAGLSGLTRVERQRRRTSWQQPNDTCHHD